MNEPVFDALDYAAKELGGETVADAAWTWLQSRESGPRVSLTEEGVREDARIWAGMAMPYELQAFGFAALDALPDRVWASRQIKRLIAALWVRMSPEEREAFIKWQESKR